MAIVFNSDAGTISGLSVGGLPDGMVDGDMLAANAVTAGKIADGTIANADINSSAAIAGSKISGSFGKVLQVVSMYTDSSTGSSVASWHATAVTASITPSSTSSKIFVMFDGQVYVQNTSGDGGIALKIQQAISGGATTSPDALHTRSAANYSGYYTSEANGQFAFRMPLSGLVSPNTTSEITYTLYFIPHNVNGSGINALNGRSTLTLMEIAG